MSAKPLGRGLDSLLGKSKQPQVAGTPLPHTHAPAPPSAGMVLKVSVDLMGPCSFQPRKEFDPSEISELADSIREHGVIQPIIARKKGDRYEIIAGERRWRASKEAGLKEVPVLVRSDDDLRSLEIALIENLQRADLNCIEEAEGYAALQKLHNLTQEQVAHAVGKARATVANSLRLLDLDDRVRVLVAKGTVSQGHAKALLAVRDKEMQYALAERTLRQGLTVRQVEKIAGELAARTTGAPGKEKKGQTPALQPALDSHLKDLQNRLRQHLGTQVSIVPHGNKGKIEIDYYNLDDLSRLIVLLGLSD